MTQVSTGDLVYVYFPTNQVIINQISTDIDSDKSGDVAALSLVASATTISNPNFQLNPFTVVRAPPIEVSEKDKKKKDKKKKDSDEKKPKAKPKEGPLEYGDNVEIYLTRNETKLFMTNPEGELLALLPKTDSFPPPDELERTYWTIYNSDITDLKKPPPVRPGPIRNGSEFILRNVHSTTVFIFYDPGKKPEKTPKTAANIYARSKLPKTITALTMAFYRVEDVFPNCCFSRNQGAKPFFCPDCNSSGASACLNENNIRKPQCITYCTDNPTVCAEYLQNTYCKDKSRWDQNDICGCFKPNNAYPVLSLKTEPKIPIGCISECSRALVRLPSQKCEIEAICIVDIDANVAGAQAQLADNITITQDCGSGSGDQKESFFTKFRPFIIISGITFVVLFILLIVLLTSKRKK